MQLRRGWVTLVLLTTWLAACKPSNESTTGLPEGRDMACSDDPVFFTACETPLTAQRDLEPSFAMHATSVVEPPVASSTMVLTPAIEHDCVHAPTNALLSAEPEHGCKAVALVSQTALDLSQVATTATTGCGCVAPCTCG